jgi:hypothetical protein
MLNLKSPNSKRQTTIKSPNIKKPKLNTNESPNMKKDQIQNAKLQ